MLSRTPAYLSDPRLYSIKVYDDETDSWKEIGQVIFRSADLPFKQRQWIQGWLKYDIVVKPRQ
jgi:hypothetical protein